MLLAGLNAQNITDSNDLLILTGGEQVFVDIEYLETLKAEQFYVSTERKGELIEAAYTGVELNDVFKAKKIDLSGEEQIVFTAEDGFTSVVNAEEVLISSNVYVVFKKDGEPITPKSEGGTGPLEIIIRQDEFPNRWCKFLKQIEVER